MSRFVVPALGVGRGVSPRHGRRPVPPARYESMVMGQPSDWYPTEEVVELSPGCPVRVTKAPQARTLMADAGRPERELADLGALIAPGSAGIVVQVDLGPDQRLRASVCIDGVWYAGEADLAAVLDRVVSDVAAAHVEQTGEPNVADSPTAVATTKQATDRVVDTAGEMLVGSLLEQHSATLSAGWWHSLTHSVSHAVDSVHHAVSQTIQRFKTPIAVAATTVATVYGGPVGGAAAAKLTGPILDAVSSDGTKRAQANAVISAAQSVARSDPKVARALHDAHRAVADTAAVYHLTATAADAAGGDREAAQKLADLDRAASTGDAAARRALSVITDAFATAANNEGGDLPTTSSAGLLPWFALGAAGLGGYAWWRHRRGRHDAAPLPQPPRNTAPPATSAGELVGAAIGTMRREAEAAVLDAYRHNRAPALGYVRDGATTSILPFSTLDDADDWFGALDARSYLYAAYFDASDPTWPSPTNESLGGPAAASAQAHTHRRDGGLL